MGASMKSGGVVALIHACLGVATAVAAFGFIGVDALMDRSAFVALAIGNPAPIYAQDVLKFASAITSATLVVLISRYLAGKKARAVRVGSAFGAVSALLLVANGALSIIALGRAAAASGPANAAERLHSLVNLLAAGALVTNGVWYLLVKRVALKAQKIPRGLAVLGLVLGIMSLIPPLSVLVLFLSVAWSAWLGSVWLGRGESPAAASVR